MNEKLDRRRKYTRMVLKESLLTKLKDKPIASLTVKAICEGADINRSTFYSHFTDPYDLLQQVEEEIVADLVQTLTSYNYSQEAEALQMTEKLLEYVADNRDTFHTLLSPNGAPGFQKRIMNIAKELALTNLIAKNNWDEGLSNYAGLFAVSGSIHVLRAWLEAGMDRTPKEMAELIIQLTQKGLSTFDFN